MKKNPIIVCILILIFGLLIMPWVLIGMIWYFKFVGSIFGIPHNQ